MYRAILLGIISLLLLSFEAWAADKYLNCDCANDGNGASASCAASGGGAGAWNTPASLSLSAGDTLTGSGTCYARMSITGGTAGNVITYAAPNGVTLDSSVSVDGAMTFTATGPPPVYGSGSSWQQVPGSKVWKKGTATPWYFLRENGRFLSPRSLYSSNEAEIVSALKPGEWTVRSTGTDSLARTIYVRTTDDGAPDGKSMRANRRDLDGTRGMLSCNGQDHWRMTGLWVIQGHNTNTPNDAAFDVIDCDDWRTDNPDGTYAVVSQHNYVGGNIDGGANGVFAGKVSDNISTGLAIEALSATLTNQRVTGEYLHNGNAPRYNGVDLNWNGDADGIGIGHGGGTVNGLTIGPIKASYNGPQRQYMEPDELGDLNRGSGIYVGTSEAMTVNGLKIHRAELRHNHRYAVFMGDEAVGWTFASSIIQDTYCNPNYGGNGAFRTQALASGSPVYTFVHNVVWGNTCYGGASFATSYASATWNIQNNVFGQNRRVGSTWFGDLHISGSQAANNETNNRFYNTLGEHPWRFGGTTYATLAEWQAATSADSGGLNDSYGDPQFIGGANPTTPEGFRPFANSFLCGAGYPTPAKYDYEGYRFGIPPNIGAYGTCAAGRTSYSIRSTYVAR